jgi:AcrR family transcriptional regulator
MPRTRSQQRYDARRESLLDAAWELVLEQGYEQTTVNGLIAYTGTSKGAFYHYFESREELMSQMVERAVRAAIEQVERGLGDRTVPALEKLDRFLGVSARRPSVTGAARRLLLQVHTSGDLVLLERLRQRVNALCIGPLERIIEQGLSEGVFDTPYPSETAEVILAAGDRALLESIRVLQSDLDAERAARELGRWAEVIAYTAERLLGLERGTLDRLPPEAVRELVELSRRPSLA